MATSADTVAIGRMLDVKPAWLGLQVASEVLGLEPFCLLHAGPPVSKFEDLPQPILNSAALAVIFEGWAKTLSQADHLLRSHRIRFLAAQDKGAVTPLAAVVSPSMKLQVVADLVRPEVRVCSPLNGGLGAAMRYGQRSEAVLDRVRWLNGTLAPILERALAEPLELLPIADRALRRGDDCHGRTAAATEELVQRLSDRLGEGLSEGGAAAFLGKSPSFFLNLWMAASKCILTPAVGEDGSSVVTAMGGNGVTSGIQVAALPGRWFTTAAAPPRGRLKEGHSEATSLGAIGDSAIVEALGLGAITWYHYGTDLREGLDDFLPANGHALSGLLYQREHSAFATPRPRVFLTVRAVVESRRTPAVSLGVLHKVGEEGLLGRGVYVPPLEPFERALEALNGH